MYNNCRLCLYYYNERKNKNLHHNTECIITNTAPIAIFLSNSYYCRKYLIWLREPLDAKIGRKWYVFIQQLHVSFERVARVYRVVQKYNKEKRAVSF